MWRLWGQARWAINKARPIGYRVRVGTAVAQRATDASLTRWSNWTLAWSSVAPDLRFAAAAAGFPTLVLAAVWTTASCRQRRRHYNCYYVMFFCIKPQWPTWAAHSRPAKWCRQYRPSLWETRQSCITNVDMVMENSLPFTEQNQPIPACFMSLPQTACLLWKQF